MDFERQTKNGLAFDFELNIYQCSTSECHVGISQGLHCKGILREKLKICLIPHFFVVFSMMQKAANYFVPAIL